MRIYWLLSSQVLQAFSAALAFILLAPSFLWGITHNSFRAEAVPYHLYVYCVHLVYHRSSITHPCINLVETPLTLIYLSWSPSSPQLITTIMFSFWIAEGKGSAQWRTCLCSLIAHRSLISSWDLACYVSCGGWHSANTSIEKALTLQELKWTLRDPILISNNTYPAWILGQLFCLLQPFLLFFYIFTFVITSNTTTTTPGDTRDQ
jgi:hypothetical protein